jgi:hypothetical protein
VESHWKVGEIVLDRVAFGVLPADDAVVTGTEKQDVAIRFSVTNDADAPAVTALVLLTGMAEGSQNAGIGYPAAERDQCGGPARFGRSSGWFCAWLIPPTWVIKTRWTTTAHQGGG